MSRWEEKAREFPQKIESLTSKDPGLGNPKKAAPSTPAGLFNLGVESAVEGGVSFDINLRNRRLGSHVRDQVV